MSIIIINQGWSGNIGDKAIARVMEQQLRQYDPITAPFAPNIPKGRNGIGKIRAILELDIANRKTFNQYISGLDERPALAIIGGGELFASNMAFNSAFVSWVKELRNKNIPVIVYGVSGSRLNILYATRNKRALALCDYIAVRDNKSQEIFKEDYLVQADIFPDIAFTYGKETYPRRRQTANRWNVLCNPLDFDYYISETRNTISFDEYLYEWIIYIENEYRLDSTVVIGATASEDFETARQLARELIKFHPDWKVKLSTTEDLDSYWNLLEDVDCVISARMHAMILALQRRCKCVPICFKEKISEFKVEYEKYLNRENTIDDIVVKSENGVKRLKMKIDSLLMRGGGGIGN